MKEGVIDVLMYIFSSYADQDEHLPELAGQLCQINNDTQNSVSRRSTSYRSAHEHTALKQDKHLNRINEPTASYQLQRPSWLLKKPIPIRSTHRDAFASLHWRGRLFLVRGPERIDSHWWQEHVQRDYYHAKHERGNLFWVYQDRRNKGWFIHGLFA